MTVAGDAIGQAEPMCADEGSLLSGDAEDSAGVPSVLGHLSPCTEKELTRC